MKGKIMITLETLEPMLERCFLMTYGRQMETRDQAWMLDTFMQTFYLTQYVKSRYSHVLLGDPLNISNEEMMLPLQYVRDNTYLTKPQEVAQHYCMNRFANTDSPYESYTIISSYIEQHIEPILKAYREDYFSISWEETYGMFALYNLGSVCGARYKMNMEKLSS
jgi:hypothetical protein